MSSECPFLKDLTAHFCELAPAKKLVPSAAISREDQRCTSTGYADCPLIKERKCDTYLNLDTCPFIHTTQVNYCAAAGNTKFIPVSENRTSRCNTTAHAYCEIFLQFKENAKDSTHAFDKSGSLNKQSTERVDYIHIPNNLIFSNNHMWMDIGKDGDIHIGIDSFLTRAFGSIETIRFLSGKGLNKPTAILTINSIDLPIIFPCRVMITSLNKTLEDHPERLLEDPYGAGWLFEYLPSYLDSQRRSPPTTDLIEKREVSRWMKKEICRMTSFLQDLSTEATNAPLLLTDGGLFLEGVARALSCPDLILMYNLFFSPVDRWKNEAAIS